VQKQFPGKWKIPQGLERSIGIFVIVLLSSKGALMTEQQNIEESGTSTEIDTGTYEASVRRSAAMWEDLPKKIRPSAI
jgi:hypothetical protein